MSLTQQLGQRGTAVREFFEHSFPSDRFKRLSKAWYEEVRAAPILCDPPVGVNAGTIGTAFDYRARLFWAPIDWKRTVAAGGMMQLISTGNPELGRLLTAVGAELERLAPERCGPGLGVDREQRICRCCYLLALYEQFFRSAAAAESSPLLEVPHDATIDALLALAPEGAIADLSAMANLLCDRLADLVDMPVVLNPTFEGSVAIGGADADILLDHMLLELKTTRRDNFERVDHLYQLLGYALLDYPNRYEIEQVGVYLARRGVLITWSIAELLDECCIAKDWTALQAEFKRAVALLGRMPVES